ncbi:hypothetical protein D3C87_243240 [compost metagenome]
MKNLKLSLLATLLIFASLSNAKAQKGVLYPKFPESFEVTDQVFETGYGKKSLVFPTGKWWFYGALVDTTGNDRPSNGKYAVRINKNNTKPCYLQMNFDVKNGASKVIVWYSSYGAKADKPATFRLEYSTDQGKTWTQTGEDIVAKIKNKQGATFITDIAGTVRFRIHKLALGNGDEDPNIANGRLSIDDFAVYQN